jgi:hypothetical protein
VKRVERFSLKKPLIWTLNDHRKALSGPSHGPLLHSLLPSSIFSSPMPSIGLHFNPPYPYPSSCPDYIYVHFPITSHLNPEDGGSMVLQNVDIQPPHYMMQQHRKPGIVSNKLFPKRKWS